MSPPYLTQKHLIQGLTNGTTYYVGVRAVNDTGYSDVVEVSGVPMSGVGVVEVDSGDRELTLNWSAAAGATSYLVRMYSPISTEFIETTELSYTFTGLTNRVQHVGDVRSKNDTGFLKGVSNWTGTPWPSVEAPGTPKHLMALPGDMQLTVTWANAPGATSHEIRYGTNMYSGTWMRASSPHVITGLTNGRTYYIQVRGKNSVGTGAVATTTGVPAAEMYMPGVEVTPGNALLHLSWEPMPGVHFYEVAVSAGPLVGSLRHWRPAGPGTTYTLTEFRPFSGIKLANGLMHVVGVRGRLPNNRVTPVIIGTGVPMEHLQNPVKRPENPMMPMPPMPIMPPMMPMPMPTMVPMLMPPGPNPMVLPVLPILPVLPARPDQVLAPVPTATPEPTVTPEPTAEPTPRPTPKPPGQSPKNPLLPPMPAPKPGPIIGL